MSCPSTAIAAAAAMSCSDLGCGLLLLGCVGASELTGGGCVMSGMGEMGCGGN